MHTNPRRLRALLLASGLAVGATCMAPAFGQTLELPAPPAARVPGSLPERGQSMAAVEARFGAPVTRGAALGRPPITRWNYPAFTVYFEYAHVVHAVPAAPERSAAGP